jgi:hypothetical protein
MSQRDAADFFIGAAAGDDMDDFSCPVEKPVGEKLKLEVPDAVVVEDHFHFRQASLLQRVLEVRMLRDPR